MGSLIEVGYVVRAHGVTGALKVIAHDPESTVLGEAATVMIGERSFTVTRARQANRAFLLEVVGIADRDAAEGLRGRPVAVDRDLIDLDEGEVFLVDLIGCEVVTEDDAAYGQVVDIEPGPQDRLVIHHGEVERLLPYVAEFIVDVDLEARLIVVDPPEGLPESPRSGRGRR